MEDRDSKETQAEAPSPNAQVNVSFGGSGLEIEVVTTGDESNPAIHFAQWIGKNVQALVMLAERDYYNMMEREAKKEPALRLVGLDGGALQ